MVPIYEYTARVIKVVDADTLWLDVDLGFDVRRKDTFRLAGLDAPERATPEGQVATTWLQDRLKPGTEVTITTVKDRRERYGRYLAVVLLKGEDLNKALLAAGHAVEYHGGARS